MTTLRESLEGLLVRHLGPDPMTEEILNFKEVVNETLLRFYQESRAKAARDFIGPRPFCQTPSGRYDAHGSYVQIIAPLTPMCAFCGRRPSASPHDPEGLHKVEPSLMPPRIVNLAERRRAKSKKGKKP